MTFSGLIPRIKGLIGIRSLAYTTLSAFLALGAQASGAEPLRLVTDLVSSNDKAPGYPVEVLTQVFAAMGQEFTFESFPTKRLWTLVLRGERDGMFATFRTREKERVCSFPDEPLDRLRWVLFVRTADIGKLKFSSFDDLIGHNVGANGPVPGVFEQPTLSLEPWEFLREHHNLVETNGSAEAFRMLAAGRIDYAVVNLSLGTRELAQMGLSREIVPLLTRSVMDEGVYVCFSKARVPPSFVSAFSQELKRFKQTETFLTISRKYAVHNNKGRPGVPATVQLARFKRLLCATLVCAFSGGASPSDSLRLVADYAPPFENLGDEKAPGFSVEVLREVFAAMDQRVSFEAYPNRRGWTMIARGEADGIFSGPRLGERERMCSFPEEPLIHDKWFFFVRTADVGRLKFSSLEDLVGREIAVPGTVPGLFQQSIMSPDTLKFLREHDNVIETNGALQGLRMLAAGRVDYALSNRATGMWNIAAMGLSGKIEPSLSPSVMEGGQYVCFSKERISPSFVNAFSEALKRFKETEAFRAIYHKYFP